MVLMHNDETIAGLVPKQDRVSVNVTTSMTYAQALALLYSTADFTKVNESSSINILGAVYRIAILNQNNQYVFNGIAQGSSSSLKTIEIRYISGTPTLFEYDLYNHSRQEITSGNCWRNGTIELVY